MFKVAAGSLKIAASIDLLIRNSSYDQLVTAVNTCVLPAGANLIQMTEGCVCLKVQVKSLAALETLWRFYMDGTLKAALQALLVTEEIIELADGEHVEAVVTINVQEYEKVRNKLANELQGKLVYGVFNTLLFQIYKKDLMATELCQKKIIRQLMA